MVKARQSRVRQEAKLGARAGYGVVTNTHCKERLKCAGPARVLTLIIASRFAIEEKERFKVESIQLWRKAKTKRSYMCTSFRHSKKTAINTSPGRRQVGL